MERGDEVIVPTNTFLATVMPLVQLGGQPVFADSELDTGNIDPASVARCISSRTVGIAMTHLWGHPCDVVRLKAVAAEHNLWLLEDGSHAHGAMYNGQEVGSLGDVAAFSFQASKMYGEGRRDFWLPGVRTFLNVRFCWVTFA